MYWFSRYLMNTDQYGALGKNKEPQLLNLVAVLENFLAQENFADDDKLRLLKNTLAAEIISMTGAGTKARGLALNLTRRLEREIQTIDDAAVFCVAVKYVVAPINHALALAPSSDKEFCSTAAKNILDTFGEKKVGLLIEIWDDLDVKGCLDAERALVVEAFMNFSESLTRLNIPHSEFDDSVMLTAFVQEFERRLGQKRKARGGNSLETVADFIFNYYGFAAAEGPTHFAADLEVVEHGQPVKLVDNPFAWLAD